MSNNRHMVMPTDGQGHPLLPPIRTFKVQRLKIGTLELTDQGVEAHRFYVDPAGALCFETAVYVEEIKGIVARVPIILAPGTWWDVVETTSYFRTRMAGLN